MRVAPFLLLLCASGTALAESAGDPRLDFAAKVEALRKKTSAAHAQLGGWCASKKIHEFAWREYRLAADLDSSCAEAQKALGRKKDGEKWVEDAAAVVKKKNEGLPDSWRAAGEEYAKKRAALGAKAAKDYEALADSASKSGLAAEAKGLWRAIVRSYDAKHEKAHLALGDVRIGEDWTSAADAARRAEAGKRITAATTGEEVAGTSEIQRALKWKTSRRRSEHFLIEARLSPEEVGNLIQISEATRATFIAEFGFKDGDFPDQVEGVAGTTWDDYKTYIDCLPNVSGETKDARKLGHFTMFTDRPFRWAAFGALEELPTLKDRAIHCTSHFLMKRAFAGVKEIPAWLDEGMSLWLSERLNASGKTFCTFAYVDDESRQLSESLKWRSLLLEALQNGNDPSLVDVLTGEMRSLGGLRAVKCWSVFDWLATAKRDVLQAAWADLRGGTELTKALFDRLGVKGFPEMNELWAKWVEENY